MRRIIRSSILLGLLAVSFLGQGGPRQVAAQASPDPMDVSTAGEDSFAPTPAPATPTPAPVVPTTSAPSPSPFPEEPEEEDDDEPDVVIDLQVTGLTQEQVEAVAALVKWLQTIVPGRNGSKVEAHVEWKGERKGHGHHNGTDDDNDVDEQAQEQEKKNQIVADTAGTNTALLSTVTATRRRYLRQLAEQKPRDRPSVPEEGLQNVTATLCDMEGYNITSITLHGNSDKASVVHIIKLLTGGSTHLSIHAGIPVLQFICASDVRMSNEAPNAAFTVMAEDNAGDSSGGSNAGRTAGIVIGATAGVAAVGAAGYFAFTKLAIGA